MKKINTCTRHSCHVLILVLYETACVYLSSTHRISTCGINGNTSVIYGEEYKILYLQCPFGFRSKTVLKRNGRFVKESRQSTLVYSFIPRKEDHSSMYSCEMYNYYSRKRSRTSATLDIRYEPYLSMNYSPNSAVEGQAVTLCCSSESRPRTTEMWWVMDGRVVSRNYYTKALCHEITNISRGDSGSYKCFAENEIGTANDVIIVTVLYPPNIPDQHIHFADTDVSRTLQCLAYGVPAQYVYGRWQHISHFREHIRYLNPFHDGKVTLPPIAKRMERYQDNGIYLCTASNRVADIFDSFYQTGKTFVMSNGPPVFVKKIERKQYGQPGNTFSLKFIVYSTSDINTYNVTNGNEDITASIQMTHINSSMVFHGTVVSVETMEIVLSFNISHKSSRQDYTVTLCNGYSNSSCVVYMTSVPIDIEEKTHQDTTVAIIVISTLVVMCAPIIGAAVFLRRKRNRRTSEDVSESESIEGLSVSVENFVYQNATQLVTFPPTSVQTTAEVIEYNRGSYVQEQIMAQSTGQLNYADVVFRHLRHKMLCISSVLKTELYTPM